MEATEQIKRFGEFFDDYEANIVENLRQGDKFLIVNFSELIGFDSELAEQLLEEPEEVIRAAEIAVEESGLEGNLKKFRVRFKNLPKTQKIMIGDIRSKHLGKLFWTEGFVRRKTDVRPQIVVAKFECVCGNTISVPQLDKKFREPTRCGGCGKKGRLKILNKELVDAQGLVLEEATEDLEGGEQPKRMHVLLKEDLISPLSEKKTSPGSRVLVVGIITEVPVALKSGGQSTRLELIIEANNIIPIDEEIFNLKLTKNEESKIIELSKRDNILQELSNSLFSELEGHDKIKEAIILQQFGGVSDDKKHVRGDFHIFLLGDPASGKTHLLEIAGRIAPKSRSVVGSGSSVVGCTATVVKDELLGSWALEVGALILASNGLCTIDEIRDIKKDDLNGFNECLDQQRITINKANIHAILKAKTTVLAASNPKYGRFDPYSSNIFQDMDLPPQLINRFDLIFILKDIPDEEKDNKIAEKIFGRRSDNTEEKKEKEIDESLMKKYILYAKKINPVLSSEAIAFLKKNYVGIRTQSKNQNEKTISINARYADALARLTQAHARMRLREKATIEDAEYALGLISYNLKEIAFDPTSGTIDIDKISSSGISTSTRSNIHIIKEAINELESRIGKTIPIDDIIAEAKLKESDVEECIERLKRDGDIFMPRAGFIQKAGG